MHYFIIKSNVDAKYLSAGKQTILGGWKPIFAAPEDGAVQVLMMHSKTLQQVREALDSRGWKDRYLSIRVDVPDGAS